MKNEKDEMKAQSDETSEREPKKTLALKVRRVRVRTAIKAGAQRKENPTQ